MQQTSYYGTPPGVLAEFFSLNEKKYAASKSENNDVRLSTAKTEEAPRWRLCLKLILLLIAVCAWLAVPFFASKLWVVGAKGSSVNTPIRDPDKGICHRASFDGVLTEKKRQVRYRRSPLSIFGVVLAHTFSVVDGCFPNRRDEKIRHKVRSKIRHRMADGHVRSWWRSPLSCSE